MLLLEAQGLGTFIFLMVLVLNLPALVSVIIGALRWKTKPDSAKKYFIFAAIYLVVGWGFCGLMMSA